MQHLAQLDPTSQALSGHLPFPVGLALTIFLLLATVIWLYILNPFRK